MFDFVQFSFIFGFMLIYTWEPRLYLYSLPQYIFCIFLWFNKNAFPHSSELRKHRTRLVSFRPSYFDLDLDIFDSVLRLVSYYIVYISVPRTLATHICSESRRLSISTTRLHRDNRSRHRSIVHSSYTHLTTLGRVTRQLALTDLVVVVFVLVSDHIDITGISFLEPTARGWVSKFLLRHLRSLPHLLAIVLERPAIETFDKNFVPLFLLQSTLQTSRSSRTPTSYQKQNPITTTSPPVSTH